MDNEETDMDIIFAVLDGLKNLEHISSISNHDLRQIAWKMYYAIDIVMIEVQSRSMNGAESMIPALIKKKMEELTEV